MWNNPHGQQLTNTSIHIHGNVTIRYLEWLQQYLLCPNQVINTVINPKWQDSNFQKKKKKKEIISSQKPQIGLDTKTY
jgi:hypothetical protein